MQRKSNIMYGSKKSTVFHARFMLEERSRQFKGFLVPGGAGLEGNKSLIGPEGNPLEYFVGEDSWLWGRYCQH